MALKELLQQIAELSVKMRFLKAFLEADSDTPQLKDREVLILHLLGERGELTLSRLHDFFPGLPRGLCSAPQPVPQASGYGARTA